MESLAADGRSRPGEDMARCLDTVPADSKASPDLDGEGLVDGTCPPFTPPVDPCTPPLPLPMEDIQVELQGADLWKRFHDIGTEMIITKAGRRMFPAVRVKIAGLDPHQQYYIAMDIMPVDNKRYRYVYHSSQWTVAGNADSALPPRLYLHPDAVACGDTWSRQVVSFDKIKLTNNLLDTQGHIILHSMHKYLPRVHVIRKDCGSPPSPTTALSPGGAVRSFSFPETVFTTVTAYQNQQITRLKIDRNPFAKGFRDSGRNRTGLEVILESRAFWRPPVQTITFEDFASMPKQPGSSTGSSPSASSAGTPSPSGSAHLLCPSPPCSPPTFRPTPSRFSLRRRDGPLCCLGLSEYSPCAYNPAPRLSHSPNHAVTGYSGLTDASYGQRQADSYPPQRTGPSLVAPAMQAPYMVNGHAGSKMDTRDRQLGSFPTSQLQDMMQQVGEGPNPSGTTPAGHMVSTGHHHTQEKQYGGFHLHGRYGYECPTPCQLSANGGKLPVPKAPPLPLCPARLAERQYPSQGMDTPLYGMGCSTSGVQQGAVSCDGRQYGAPPSHTHMRVV